MPDRKQFRSFREALHHVVTVLSREQRDVSYNLTADGKEWRRPDLLAINRPKLSLPRNQAN